MTNFYIYLSVVVCGAAVLAIEILGTRVIAPFYGASLYLWSALITVTLAALSLGYAIGGRYADRGTRLNRYATLIGLAGIWIVLIPWVKGPIMSLTETFGLRAAVLVSATVLFFPPLTLLGMVTPYALRMKAESINVVGRTAGNLYAISTIASVVAAVVTGFYLIPNLGVVGLLYTVGIILIVTALLGWVIESKGISGAALPLLLIAGALFSLAMTPHQQADPENGLLAVEQSAYAEIRVVEMNDYRYMFIDGSMHSSADIYAWESNFEYVHVLDIPRYFYSYQGEMLLIGLGGGSIAKNYAREGWEVDAVEIDPVVTTIAHQYFGLDSAEADIYEMDGRQYLITSDKKYDIIILDAFGSSSIPFHLATTEAFDLMKSRLVQDGMLAMNLHSIGWHSEIVKALAATLNRQFTHVKVLPIAEPPNKLGNIILLATDQELDIDMPIPIDRFSIDYHRAHAWDNSFVVDTAGVTVLTDDLNPVDLWSEQVNLESRRELHELLGDQGIFW